MKQIQRTERIKRVTNENNSKNVVVMRRKKLKDIFFDKETINKLLKSEADIENGRTRKASEVFEELKEKYDF